MIIYLLIFFTPDIQSLSEYGFGLPEERWLPETGLVRSLFENPDELCERLHLKIQEKLNGNVTKVFLHDIVATLDELSEYKTITPTHLKKNFRKIILKLFKFASKNTVGKLFLACDFLPYNPQPKVL